MVQLKFWGIFSEREFYIWMNRVIELGEINLRPDTGELGREVMQGNVYIGDQPVCDDGWGTEEARVACR